MVGKVSKSLGRNCLVPSTCAKELRTWNLACKNASKAQFLLQTALMWEKNLFMHLNWLLVLDWSGLEQRGKLIYEEQEQATVGRPRPGGNRHPSLHTGFRQGGSLFLHISLGFTDLTWLWKGFWAYFVLRHSMLPLVLEKGHLERLCRPLCQRTWNLVVPEGQLDLSDISERRTLELAWGYFLRVLVKLQPTQQF